MDENININDIPLDDIESDNSSISTNDIHLESNTNSILTNDIHSELDNNNISINDVQSDTNTITSSETVIEWKTRCIKIAFIYDFILNKYKKRVDLFTLLTFFLSSLTTLFALGNFGLSELDYPDITLSLKTISVILSTSSSISASIIKMRGWNEMIENCQKYLDMVENFIALIISEQSLPSEIEPNHQQFIQKHKDKFLTILDSAPNISHDDYLQALDNYKYSKCRFRNECINV